MNRRTFIQRAAVAAGGTLLGATGWSKGAAFPQVRVCGSKRKFKSVAVERTIDRLQGGQIAPELAWMFGNCFPNTLDTTVEFQILDGRPDTYVITGDIDAMWLRDSSAQVWPYLPLTQEDLPLRQLIAGVINRQTRCILRDPYANAFYKDRNRTSQWDGDLTEMKPGVHERKWEIDSLCYPIRLAYHYWKTTRDEAPFDGQWRKALALTLQTFREQQRKNGAGPYQFQRQTEIPSDTLMLNGYGQPARPTGLIFSMFRPSDDATVFPLLVPSNFFAVVSLRQAAEMLEQIARDNKAAAECRALADEVECALRSLATIQHPKHGAIYAYEIDAYGSFCLMDDANVPDLLSLPYLSAVKLDDPVYQSTRQFVLSDSNPYYFKGSAAKGLGGPHAGLGMIWPLGLIMQAMTSTNDEEIRYCLETLRRAHAGTGFMHEAFDKDNQKKFSRPWFAWANTIFGELMLKLDAERPWLLSA